MNVHVTPTISGTEGRAANRAALEACGVDLFPAPAFRTTHRIEEVPALFNVQAETAQDDRDPIRIAGRIFAIRRHGKACFVDLWQEHEQVQIHISKDGITESEWFIVQHLDLGDFIGTEGTLFRTRRDELTVAAHTVTLLGKPLTTPAIGKQTEEGVRGAQADVGALLRDRRHVKFLTSREVFDGVKAHATVLGVFRDVMAELGFMEAQTSLMGRYYGGAAATPFTTKCKALDTELFLRVSPEPDLKRMLAGGFERVYEIGRNCRNEGIDATHQPSFTAFEAYQANADYFDMMDLTEQLIARSAKALHGTYRIHVADRVLDFEPPWPRLRIIDLVAHELGVSAADLTYPLMAQTWDERQLGEEKPGTWGELMVALFEDLLEDGLIGPCFVLDHPVEVSPLTKKHRDDPRLTERFEAYLCGVEIANAYSELNDPVEQRSRLEQQDLVRDEPYGVDAWFLAAIEDGMPQAGGLGIGLDRLVMILTGSERITDVIPFPVA